MKSILLSLAYIKRVRWLLVVLIMMMTISIIFGILVMGQIQHLRSSLDIVSSTKLDPEKIYYYQELLSTSDLVSGNYMYRDNTSRLLEDLKENPSIENTYTIRAVGPLSYNDNGVSILLYEPELLTLFPALSQLGITFTNSTSCVLGSRLFNHINVDDSIDLTFKQPSEHTEAFTVSGRLSYPYQYMMFGVSSTKLHVDHLFQSGHIIIMQDNEETDALFSKIASIRSGGNFFFTFSENATQEDINNVFSLLEPFGIVVPLSEILTRSKVSLQQVYMSKLPMPLFLLIVSCFSYYSTLVLVFKKKEKHLAIYHLCGGSRHKCIFSILLTFSVISLIPTVITSIIVLCIPYLDWIGMVNLNGSIIDNRCLIVIAISFLVTQLIAFVVTWSQFRNHTPLSLLRGTQK